jgi:hypothetical protein
LICEIFCIYFVAFKKNGFSCGNQIRLVLNPRQHETNKGELYKVFFLLVANTDPAGAVTNATDFKESIFCRTNGKKNPFRSPEARRSNIFFWCVFAFAAVARHVFMDCVKRTRKTIKNLMMHIRARRKDRRDRAGK